MDTSTEHYAELLGDIPFWARAADGGVLFSEIPVRSGGRTPSFFIIGAPKAATTSLQAYLSQHPQIFMCEPKEPHFFSTDAIYARGLDWYRGLFADARDGQICGEASTSYTRYPFTPDVPKRIHDVAPDAKLIYLVREPVARVNSACMYALRRQQAVGREVFERSVDSIIHHADFIASTSEYMVQLEQYLRLFDRSQILVLLQEDLADDPIGNLRKTFEFLGVDPEAAVDSSKRLNETSDYVDRLRREHAMRWAQRVPGYRVIKSLIPQSLRTAVRERLTSRVSGADVITPMSDGMKQKLKDRFAPLNDRLAEFLGRDLSHWR